MDLVLGYVAGLLTLINPCVLPVLPIVLATAMQTNRWGPVALAAGMSLSFVVVGLSVAVFGRAVGIDDVMISRVGAVMMVAFGLVLLIPRASAGFAMVTAGVSANADTGFDRIDRSSLRGQALGGALLGAVWVPCVGPTLGGAIALASAGQSVGWAGAIMASFALGISTVILALAYGAQSAIRARRDALRGLAMRARPVMGAVFILTGLAIWFHWFQAAEIWLLDTLPYWLQDLSVRF